MKRFRLAFLAIILIASNANLSEAAPAIDQINTDDGLAYVGYSQVGQSFVAGLTGKLTSLDLFSGNPNRAAGDAVVSIYAGDGLSGPTLASATLAALIGSDRFSYDLSMMDFDVIAGMQYTFNVDAGTRNLAGNADFGNGYSSGVAYFNGSYISTGYDLTFATYVRPSGSAVPEPTSWLLMVVGFGMIGGVLRFRGGRAKLLAS